MDWEPLVEAARQARERAHAPYSRFAVGAAVRTRSGRVFVGCNVENRSYGATLCAERSAVAAAVAAGDSSLEAVVVVTDVSPPAPPCGICRDVLAELGSPELPVLMVNLRDERRELALGELLPHPFRFSPRA